MAIRVYICSVEDILKVHAGITFDLALNCNHVLFHYLFDESDGQQIITMLTANFPPSA